MSKQPDTRKRPNCLYVGLDAGGTKTEIRVISSRSDLRVETYGPGANLQRSGLADAAGVLAELVLRAAASFAPEDRLSICAGVAGAGDADSQQQLAEAMVNRLVTAGAGGRLGPVQVVEDGLVALEAALGGQSGGVAVVGTGSAVLGRTRSSGIIRVGGWGYLLGDEGSGYAIGLAGLRLLAAAMDGQVAGALPERIVRRFDIRSRSDLIFKVYQQKWPVQQVAPLVLETAAEGDPWAEQLVDRQVQLLAAQVERMAQQADEDIEPQLALLGGLSEDAYFTQSVADALADQCPAWHLMAPVNDKPVAGAVALARKAADVLYDNVM